MPEQIYDYVNEDGARELIKNIVSNAGNFEIKKFPSGDWTTLDDGIYVCTGLPSSYERNKIITIQANPNRSIVRSPLSAGNVFIKSKVEMPVPSKNQTGHIIVAFSSTSSLTPNEFNAYLFMGSYIPDLDNLVWTTIEDINISDYYTKEEIDNKLSEIKIELPENLITTDDFNDVSVTEVEEAFTGDGSGEFANIMEYVSSLEQRCQALDTMLETSESKIKNMEEKLDSACFLNSTLRAKAISFSRDVKWSSYGNGNVKIWSESFDICDQLIYIPDFEIEFSDGSAYVWGGPLKPILTSETSDGFFLFQGGSLTFKRNQTNQTGEIQGIISEDSTKDALIISFSAKRNYVVSSVYWSDPLMITPER